MLTQNIQSISNAVGKELYEKGIIGYISLDLISFPNPNSPLSHPLFWYNLRRGIDLDCYMTDQTAVTFFFDFLMVI